MKKILCSLLLLLACMAIEAKVVRITLKDGSVKVYTSSELSAIDFNDDGTLTITTYDGKQLPALNADFDVVSIGDDAVVTEIYRDTLSFNINADGIPVNLHTDRAIVKMNYVYPSTDPFGEPITLSGTILIPEEIWWGRVKSEGILMLNHYTKFHRDEAPTISNGELENIFLANPLYPNYIIVQSDLYGFGATVRFPQAFMQGLNNARASLDGLIAARKLLQGRGFNYGPLCFNIGYSSGGFDALASLKVRDMEYANRIRFDKTFSGGGPSDVREAYRQYVLTDSTAYNAVPLLLMVCTNEIQQLGLDYNDVFQPNVAKRIGELILSKNFSSWPVCDSIGREKKIHEILSPTYCDLESPESMAMQNLFAGLSMTNDDWTPDLSNRIYLFHSRGDDYVPFKSARPMVPFLKSKGFNPSIIPGKTNLQTNFVVPKLGHLTATLIYYVQTLAAIHAWPQMYINGQLDPRLQAILDQQVDIVSMMRQLDAMGIDCRAIITGIVNQLSAIIGGAGESIPQLDPMTVAMLLDQQLAKLGLSTQDLVEMSEDSGLDIQKLIMDLVAYFNEKPANDETDNGNAQEGNAEEGNGQAPSAPARRAAQLIKAIDQQTTPADDYEQQLRQWLKEGGVLK